MVFLVGLVGGNRRSPCLFGRRGQYAVGWLWRRCQRLSLSSSFDNICQPSRKLIPWLELVALLRRETFRHHRLHEFSCGRRYEMLSPEVSE